MEVFYRIVSLLGGLALFLYGMRIMGDGLKSSSGGAMKAGLAKVTGNPVVGFIFGMLVTCMIQSSTAAIVLTVGLVGAGFLDFRKSVGIVLGANVGTAITAQIIRLMDLQAGANSILYFFKSDNLAPMALIVGIILIMFVGTRTANSVGTIFMGFGILFVGLMNMSSAVSSMGDALSGFLLSFESNYFLGFLAGVIVTGVIQSSSAVVGILQTLASSVGVTFCGVFAVIIGVNIGDCLTTYLVCRIGAKPDQVRTVTVHVIYNFIAAPLLFIAIAILRGTGVLNDDIWYMTLNSGGVANVHGLFRVIPAVCLLPFANKFADLAEKLVPDKPVDPEDADIEKNLRELDTRLLINPGLALNESGHLITHMADTALHNLDASWQQMTEYDPKRKERIAQREDLLDRMADSCNQYVVAVSPYITLEHDQRLQNYQLKAMSSFERIGDLAVNISETVERLRDKKQEFSKQAMADLAVGYQAVRDVVVMCRQACKTDRTDSAAALTIARRVEPLEETIDDLLDALNERHIARIVKGKCSVENGIEYQNVLQNLERISDQCSDYAVYLLGKSDATIEGKEHELIHEMHHTYNADYSAAFETNHNKYFGMLTASKKERKAIAASAGKAGQEGTDSSVPAAELELDRTIAAAEAQYGSTARNSAGSSAGKAGEDSGASGKAGAGSPEQAVTAGKTKSAAKTETKPGAKSGTGRKAKSKSESKSDRGKAGREAKSKAGSRKEERKKKKDRKK